MNGMKSKTLELSLLLILLTTLACGRLFAQQGTAYRGGIEFSFANPELVEWEGESYFSLDVMACSADSDRRLGTGIVLLNYNPEVFGYSVRTNNNVIVTQGDLVLREPFPFYYFIINDNTGTRLAITFEYLFSAGNGGLLSTTPQQLLNIKFKVIGTGHRAGISFEQNMMSSQQYWDDNATLFDPVVALDVENSLIPSLPLHLALTITGDVVFVSWDQVSGCTYSVYSAVDPLTNDWQLEASGLTEPAWSQAVEEDKKFFRVTATGTQQ